MHAPDGDVKRVARMRSPAEEVGGQLDERVVVKGLEDRGHGVHGDDERGDGARRDDPAVRDGDADAWGDVVHDGGPEEELGGRWQGGWRGVRVCVFFGAGDRQRGHRGCDEGEDEDEWDHEAT